MEARGVGTKLQSETRASVGIGESGKRGISIFSRVSRAQLQC